MGRFQPRNYKKHDSNACIKRVVPHQSFQRKHTSKHFLKIKSYKISKKELCKALKRRKQLCKRLLINIPTVPDATNLDIRQKDDFSRTLIKDESNALHTDGPYSDAIPQESRQSINKVYADKALPYGCTVIHVPFNSIYFSAVLVTFQNNTECLKIYGQAKITVVKGACLLNGFKLKCGITNNVYAPVTHPAMALQPSNESKSVTDDDIIGLLNLNADIKSSMDTYDVIVLFQPSSKDFDGKTFPGYLDIYKSNVCKLQGTQKLTETCWACNTDRYFKDEQYKGSIQQIMCTNSELISNDITSSNTHLVVMTIGGKNAGKSTFNRYLIHKLLDRYERVYYLECDVGQTEFTPSGIVSMHCVKRTDGVLGPPFTHQTFSGNSCFYGNKTTADDPDRYIESINFLLDLFRQDDCHRSSPLVVNTMGWIRALGLQLLVDISRMIQPTHVIQFESQRAAQNLLPFTPHFLHSANGWTSVPEMSHPPNYKLIMIDGLVELHKSTKYLAPDFRNLSLLAYLSKMARQCLNTQGMQSTGKLLKDLQKVKPYCVKLSSMVICNATDTPVKYKYAMALLNASLVGLCVLPGEKAAAWKNPPENKMIHPADVCPCLGIGLVRGVDKSSGTVYVISDLPPDQLSSVNCLTYGYLTLPDSLILQQDKKKSNNYIPYVTTKYPYETIGASMFKVHRKFKQLTNP